LGPLGTAATNRPIVPAPGDYDDGEIGGMVGRANRSTGREPTPVPPCRPQPPHAARTRTRTAAVGFVVDKVALGQFSPSTSVSPANLHSTNFSGTVGQ
jgi:hypothetical protein